MTPLWHLVANKKLHLKCKKLTALQQAADAGIRMLAERTLKPTGLSVLSWILVGCGAQLSVIHSRCWVVVCHISDISCCNLKMTSAVTHIHDYPIYVELYMYMYVRIHLYTHLSAYQFSAAVASQKLASSSD